MSIASPGLVGQSAQPAAPASAAARLIQEAARAEAELRFDAAADRLSQLVVEYPRAPEAADARARLARVLALAGDLPAAMVQCQALADTLAPVDSLRRQSLDLATTLSRRLRFARSNAYFGAPAAWTPKILPELDEPGAIAVNAAGVLVLTDTGAGRAYRIEADVATAVKRADEIGAVLLMPDGTVATIGKTGLALGASAKPVPLGGSWGGRARRMEKPRSAAVFSNGDVLVVDRDYDGLLRCPAGSGTCAPWGPAGKVRTIKIGPSDFVLLLDDRRETVRLVDRNGRVQATVGPTIGAGRVGQIVDVAFDQAFGIYLLDADLKKVQVLTLTAGADNRLSVAPLTSLALPAETPASIKNPTALGVAPDGTLVVAGRSLARLLRYQ